MEESKLSHTQRVLLQNQLIRAGYEIEYKVSDTYVLKCVFELLDKLLDKVDWPEL